MTYLNNTTPTAAQHHPDAKLLELGRRWNELRHSAERADRADEDSAINAMIDAGSDVLANCATTLAGAAAKARVVLHAAQIAFGSDSAIDFAAMERELAAFLPG